MLLVDCAVTAGKLASKSRDSQRLRQQWDEENYWRRMEIVIIVTDYSTVFLI